jgi:hypothetical protein
MEQTSSCWCRNLMYPEASCRTEAVSVCQKKHRLLENLQENPDFYFQT